MNLGILETILGVSFKDRMLLLSAITHRSYLNEVQDHPVPHNERLEFIGDAVLEMITTEHIYLNHNLPEGVMTNIRTLVVNYKHLAEVAQELGLEAFVLISKGQTRDSENARRVILANSVEAIIGAMYLDRGYDVCREFISRWLLVKLTKLIKDMDKFDPKSTLQEKTQAKWRVTPTYQLVSATGDDHNPQFTMAVLIGTGEIGRGRGPSKKEAQANAARDALGRF